MTIKEVWTNYNSQSITITKMTSKLIFQKSILNDFDIFKINFISLNLLFYKKKTDFDNRKSDFSLTKITVNHTLTFFCLFFTNKISILVIPSNFLGFFSDVLESSFSRFDKMVFRNKKNENMMLENQRKSCLVLYEKCY